MNPLEGIWYELWRGIAIGIIISAPMGPVGILTIQRTLLLLQLHGEALSPASAPLSPIYSIVCSQASVSRLSKIS